MAPRDLDRVVALADRLFPDHPEEAVHFAERLALGARLCLTLSHQAGDVGGYAVAYPWPPGQIPPLNESLAPVPMAEGSAYLHDFGIEPAISRSGHARAGLAMLVERARVAGLRRLALVAVNRTVPFWQGQGFEICEADPAMAAKLASYGSEARYMIRDL
nr:MULTISPECIES: GNAT family N-acetyltransferase [Methylobacterium]